MTISCCIVIPVYNHGDAIGRTVQALRVHGLKIILVDDGSDAATQRQLAPLADGSHVQLLRLPSNRGKGVAAMTGFREAHRQGFTHVIQIDADGQHDATDVPKFVAAASANPSAMICGQAVYDRSVPTSRKIGRYITHTWVWIETLSFRIKDSMCGFRLYPLAQTIRVIDRSHIGARMDFDTEIAVRLAWTGVPAINIPTHVAYPLDGVSHFRMWHDNARISLMHTRLCFGMLWRLPWLLWRKVFPREPGSSAPWWRLAERGSYLGILTVFYLYRFLGRGAARAVLYPVAIYFFLAAKTAREGSLKFLRRVYDYTRERPVLPHAPTWRDGVRHVLAFAESGLDKVAAWLGRLDHSQVEFPNRGEIDALIARRQGAVLVGAHLGNWEMTRALAAFSGYGTINAVVYTDHAQRFNRLLERLNQRFRLNLIQISSLGPETAILLQEKIDRGELLVIVGDRTPPAENGRVVRVPFLGQDAPFAQGPFLLAGLLGCPVYLFFCLKEQAGYRIHLEHFCDRVELPRKQRADALREYIRRYAERLEYYCLRAPFQWFNFYDFWRDESAAEKSATQEHPTRHELDDVRTKHA